jgi:CTP:phosphocholine cytidylyltransferase-like protein
VEVTDDWCLKLGKSGFVNKMTIGGSNCYHMYGISFWNEDDGLKLYHDISNVYSMPGGKERYWDQVALEYCIENYKVEVRKCTFNDIVEIDTFTDLKKIDKTYC